MQGSILDNLPAIKDTIRQYAQTAETNGWISPEECKKTIRRLDEDSITIGVIGQMKAGKSTFLNALLFEKEVLPAASTPMTAALTEITYGETPAIEAEFYTIDDWEGIKMASERSLDNLNEKEKNEVQAAKELVEKSRSLDGQIYSLLGTKKTASFNEIHDYASADGRYVSITKSVKIKYPLEMLKGVQIVDTPGFNDPVVSREQRSVEFLAKADVVILLLYSGRAFDETDREIIFERVRNVGVGKIIIAVNKYDVDFAKGESEEDITNYVKDQIIKAVWQKQDPALEKLLGNPNPILFSAYMALLAKKPLSEIRANETDNFHYNRLCNDVFEIHTQQEMYQKSHIARLQYEIDELLKKEKIAVLVDKSINEIRAKIDSRCTGFNKIINQLTDELKNLALNPEELEERIRSYERAQKKISRTITAMENDLREFVDDKRRDAIRRFEKLRNGIIPSIKQSIDSAKTGEEAERRVSPQLWELNQNLKDEYENIYRSIKTELKTKKDEIILDLEELIIRYSYGDEEKSRDYVNSCNKELEKFNDISFEDMFQPDDEYIDSSGWGTNFFSGVIGGFLTGITFGIFRATKLQHKFTWIAGGKGEALRNIDNMLPPLEKLRESLSPLNDRMNEFVGSFRQLFETDLINVILEQAEKARDDYSNREKNKKSAEAKLEKAEADKKLFEEKASEANGIIKALRF